MIVLHVLLSGPAMPDQSAYRFTPFSFAPGGQKSPLWSPDGKAVAYAARGVDGPYETYIRYLDSATPVDVTHTAESAAPIAWASPFDTTSSDSLDPGGSFCPQPSQYRPSFLSTAY